MYANESSLDKKSVWYFGNNKARNLKLVQPKWYAPFFMTTDYKYAEEYADYGVYTITLKNEAKSKILDFNKDLDVKKLKWPKELIDDIRTGKSDLNGIAYDMYILAGHGHSQEVFDKSWHLSDAAYDFDERSYNIFDIVPKHANWASEKDHRFVLQMWKDIHDAGFDGFTHFEFGKRILALFDFKCMDKISITPVKASLNEDSHRFYDIDKNDEVVAKCRNPIGKIGISTYDDINAAGIGSFEIFKPYRRMGHAKNVLQKLVQKLKSKYSLVYCFVDKDNYPALSLYKQLGKVSNHLNANGQYEVEFWKTAEDNQSTASRNIKNLFDEAFPQEKKLAEAHISPSSTKSNPLLPMTKQELQQIEKEFGTTDNFQESGWILPDGKLLQMRRNTERWAQHDFVFPPDSYYARAGISEDDDISQILLQAGFIRINFSNNPCTVDLRVKPTGAQMDRLYDLIDLDYSSMKDYFYKLKSCLDEFQLELPGKLIRYEDEDEFKKRFLNDIRNEFSYSLNESKATYLQKYRDEADAKKIVDAFWQIKSRLSAPQNDIDWWIKKPFADLKSFVLNYSPANKKQRRDADYRKQALENDAKLLDTRDGYEIWYVPTYEAMRILGRFYKGRSAKWCVASDDPEFWFDNHDEDEFVVLVREQPKNDEFDKVALQMTGHGRYFNQNQIIPWDLENNDYTFTARYYMTGLDLASVEDLIYYAWHLFKDNGEQREQYYDVD